MKSERFRPWLEELRELRKGAGYGSADDFVALRNDSITAKTYLKAESKQTASDKTIDAIHRLFLVVEREEKKPGREQDPRVLSAVERWKELHQQDKAARAAAGVASREADAVAVVGVVGEQATPSNVLPDDPLEESVCPPQARKRGLRWVGPSVAGLTVAASAALLLVAWPRGAHRAGGYRANGVSPGRSVQRIVATKSMPERAHAPLFVPSNPPSPKRPRPVAAAPSARKPAPKPARASIAEPAPRDLPTLRLPPFRLKSPLSTGAPTAGRPREVAQERTSEVPNKRPLYKATFVQAAPFAADDHAVVHCKPGEVIEVNITVRNDGSQEWFHGYRPVTLGVLHGLEPTDDDRARGGPVQVVYENPRMESENPDRNRVHLDGDERILPGATKTFCFKLRVPEKPGPYPVTLQVVMDGGPEIAASPSFDGWFRADAVHATFLVNDPPA